MIQNSTNISIKVDIFIFCKEIPFVMMKKKAENRDRFQQTHITKKPTYYDGLIVAEIRL